MKSSHRTPALLLLALAFSFQAASASQSESPTPGQRIHRSVPPAGAATHVVVPGGRFQAGEFKRWFYGANYRDLWNTPIEVAVLDLDGVGGGLTPLRTGGFGQSVSLHFTGNDGRRYTVRSLDKDATRRVPDEIANTVVGDVLQDLICAMLPTGALVVDPLMEAAGILHSRHTLVVIPDDPRLKEYRERFAGLIGMLQEHPSEGKDDAPGFAGSRKVSGTDKLRDHLEKSPCNRVDARAFLKARLMDFLVNDKDRHYGQWRWARFPDGDCYTWLPIPEDRDQAFIHFEGVAMAIARGRFPIQIKFKEKFPNLIGLTMTGWEIDREFLAELDRATWDSVVSAFRRELPDAVIENAVRRLPPPYYSLIGESLTRALKSRRDALPEFAGRYYEMINRKAEIKTTDKDEYVHCEHLPDGNLNVRIGLMKGAAGEKNPPYFQRTFQPGETREVRIHLRGGDDRAEVSGPGGPIVVHIDGGGGDDTLTNGSESGASKTRFYDSRGKNRFVTGKGARIDESSYQRPHGTHTPNARYALDWGKRTGSLPIFMIDPDLTVYTGVLHSRQYFGYRKDPFSAQHTFVAGLAGVNGFESVRPFLSYTGHFRRPLREFDANVRFDFSGIRSLRFYGFGNETEIRRPRSFYKVTRYSLVLAPALEYRGADYREETSGFSLASLRSRLNVHFGPVIKYSNTPSGSNKGTLIGSLDNQLYGVGAFGQIGAQGEITFDTRNNPGYPTRGIRVMVGAAIYPEMWNVDSMFGSIRGEASTYLTAPVATHPTLALRGGARKVWGSYPFFEGAFLGGTGVVGTGISGGNLRGYQKNRFAGDTVLYGNSELRLVLTQIELFVAGELGLFGIADAGRVFFEEDPASADKWHTSIGGGIWLSFLHRRHTLSAAFVKGDDLTGVYLRSGFMF